MEVGSRGWGILWSLVGWDFCVEGLMGAGGGWLL